MTFDSMNFVDNLTAIVDVPSVDDPYSFYQIGMIYRVLGAKTIGSQLSGKWIDPKNLSQERCSALLWQFQRNFYCYSGN